MKKVLLVNTNMEKFPYPTPPLGICLLAAGLERGYRVRIYDGTFDEGKTLEKTIGQFKPDYIGIGIRNIDNLDLFKSRLYLDEINQKLIKTIKKTSIPAILGGSGFSIFPRELLNLFDIDYGIVGEGEKAFAELLKALESNKNPDKIKGIIVRDGKRNKIPDSLIYNSLTSKPADISILPLSRIYNRIDFTPYRERGSYPVQTKRGCPHRCIYCTYPLIEGKAYRIRSPESIALEIEETCRVLDNITFEFVDSTFNDPKGHAEKICQAIIKRGLKVRLRTMGINPCNVTAELIELMKQAGFAQIDCTPDSASAKMIKALGKNFTIKHLEQAALLIKEHDMPTMWFFIFGGPGETAKTIDESFDFIDKFINEEDMVHITMGLRIYPNTKLYHIASQEKLINQDASLLQPQYYVSPFLGKEKLTEIIKEKISQRHNCVLSTESTPEPWMLKQALDMRKELKLKEPMFRTLLRIHKKRILRN